MPPNFVFGWIWILAGLLTGTVIGTRFQREDWLGGYASHPRRLIRLGHVSFLGTGLINILFAVSAPAVALSRPWASVTAGALIAGAVTMPACCALMAWRRTLQPVFAVPVLSLLLGVGLAVFGMLRP
jgi:hypothetical protein